MVDDKSHLDHLYPNRIVLKHFQFHTKHLEDLHSNIFFCQLFLLLIRLFSEQLFDEYFVEMKIVQARIPTQIADVMRIVRSLSLDKRLRSNVRLVVVPSREDEFPLDGVPPPPLRFIMID